jgi:hypothetical protein
VLRIEAGEEHNLSDMREFLGRTAARPKIAQALDASGRTAAEFVDTMLDRCRGLWIYLQYVTAEIELGHYDPLDLEALPYGVWQYYAEFWTRWRGTPAWRTLVLPLLGTLAAVQEDVTGTLLYALAGIADADAAGDLLNGAWRPFLTVTEGTESRYRCYHASLREFLDGRGDLSELTAQQRVVAEELAGAPRQAHARIAERYLGTWGGLDGDLTGLQDATRRALDGDRGVGA